MTRAQLEHMTVLAPEHARAIRARIAYDSSLAGCAT